MYQCVLWSKILRLLSYRHDALCSLQEEIAHNEKRLQTLLNDVEALKKQQKESDKDKQALIRRCIKLQGVVDGMRGPQPPTSYITGVGESLPSFGHFGAPPHPTPIFQGNPPPFPEQHHYYPHPPYSHIPHQGRYQGEGN